MDGNRILLACIISAVFTGVYSELGDKNVKRNSKNDKYTSSKYNKGKHAEETSRDTSNTEHWSKTFNLGSENKRELVSNAKYTQEKPDDYNEDKEEKQYDTDNTDKVKDKNSGTDYGSDYKGNFDGGEDSESAGKKEYSDGDTNGMSYSKDTYTATDKSPDVTCSYGVKFIAHPDECTKFYQCAHSKPFLFTCPSGLHFNTDLDVCDWPSNVDCSSDDPSGPNYKTSYKTSEKSHQGPTYHSSHEPDYREHEYKIKSKSHSNPRVMTSHKSTPAVYEDTEEYSKDTDHQSKVYTDSHSFKDNSKYKKSYHSISPQKPSSHYPLSSPYHHMMAPFLPVGAMHFPMVPVIQSPMYQPFVPLHSSQNQSPVFLLSKVDDHVMKQSGDEVFKESTVGKESKKQEESIYQNKKTESSESKTQTSRSSTVNTANDGKTQIQTVKKVIIKKFRPVLKQEVSGKDKTDVSGKDKTDVSGKDKTDDASNKRFYYYYYEDDIKDSNRKGQESAVKQEENKNTYYYYVDGSKSDSYKDKRQLDDYNNKYDYYYGNNNYDYNYDDSSRPGHSRVQHLVSVDNKYNNNNYNKKHLKSSANYKAANEMSDEELGFIHFNHMGRGSKTKSKGEGLGDIGSLLPLMLLGGANGGQQLLMTSLLLSSLKPGGNRKGGQTKGRGEKDDLIKQLVLLSLLNGNGNNNILTGNNNIPTANVPNVQMMNGQFVDIATGQPVVLIDPATGQQVTPAQVSVNPSTGQLVATATGNPVFVQDPVTGNLQPAVVGNTLQGNPLLPVAARRRPGRRVNFGANMNNINNRFIPLAPALANQNTAATSASGRDAVNLIFLSPLTPSSLPPPINNDGSATLIRGSLRDILGPNLANFISNVPLVPGQGPPNSAAGSKQSCNVVRSGETVPFRISPRGGRLLPSECDAIGKLLDKFVPTFLQNFVPSDAAFAGFGSSNNNRSGNNSQQSVTIRSNINETPSTSSSTVSSGTDSNFIGSGSINDFINVRNDHNGCTIAVPNIVSQC